VTQIKLRLASVLCTELNVLFAAFVFHPQFVQARCADNVTRAVQFSDMVNVAGVVQGMSDIRTIRIAFMERNGDFSALYQREVEAVLVTTVRFGKRTGILSMPCRLSSRSASNFTRYMPDASCQA
jgi:hypothetical protein